MVICLEQGADLHTAQLMSLPLTVSCFSKIQIGFTFLVPAHLGSSGQRAVKRVCVCVCVRVRVRVRVCYSQDGGEDQLAYIRNETTSLSPYVGLSAVARRGG